MLFNFDWLKKGELFPPRPEIARMKGYRDNEALFKGDYSMVLEGYLKRLRELIFGVHDTGNPSDTFFDCPNYWQLSTIKTVDLTFGDNPNIMCEKEQEALDETILDSDLMSKLDEILIDYDSKGESIIVPYINAENERTFSVNNPGLWIPICNPENPKEIEYDCMCWTVCVKQDIKNPINSVFELHCKIQKRGDSYYTLKKYKISTHYFKEHIDMLTKENFGRVHFFQIGSLLSEEKRPAPYKQAIIQFPGITTSDTVHGISNYERITSIVGEIAIREALAGYILDQNSVPRMSAPESAFIKTNNNRWVLKSGGKSFVVKPGESPPVYVTWDGNLTSNEERIRELKRELYSLSELGSVLSVDDMNSSQGYEALEVKMTNPKLKARRICKKFDKPLKQLLCFLLGKDDIKPKDISIIYNYGLPATENQNLDMAMKKKSLGVSTQSVLTEYFGLTEEEAEAEVEKAREENADSFMGSFMKQNANYDNKNKPSDNKNDESDNEEDIE